MYGVECLVIGKQAIISQSRYQVATKQNIKYTQRSYYDTKYKNTDNRHGSYCYSIEAGQHRRDETKCLVSSLCPPARNLRENYVNAE